MTFQSCVAIFFSPRVESSFWLPANIEVSGPQCHNESEFASMIDGVCACSSTGACVKLGISQLSWFVPFNFL